MRSIHDETHARKKEHVWLYRFSRATMPLVGDVRGVRPPITNVLYHAMWHNLPHVVNEATQLLFFFQICGVVPKPVVLQRLPIPLIVFAPLGVVCYPRITSSVGFEIGRCNARSAQTEVTGWQLVTDLRQLGSAGLIRADSYGFFVSSGKETNR